jgi:predicted ATPase
MVLISAAIAHLVHQTFAFESFGLHELRGIHAPMAVLRVLYALDERLGVDEANRQRFARLVGRQAELDFLLGRWQAVQQGQGQVVWLRGEAGIGKSSLLHHLRGRLRPAGVTTVTLRCSPYTQNSDLYPFIAHAQRVAGWERHDTPESKLDKLEQMLRRSKQPLEKTVPLFARLLSFQLPPGRYPEPRLTPQALRQQMVETLVALTPEEAACHPLLFVWEDLHWADPSTLGIIGMLLEQTPAVPMLTILAYRPEFVPPWPSAPHIASLTLPRLERDEVAYCIAQLTNKALPAEVVQHVIDKTDGIPLYIEEFTRMLLESDFLADGEDGYVLTGQLAEAEIPATLQGSLMARLDQLQSAKEVAQPGAVLGREFSYEMLQAMVGMDPVTLHTHVSRLVDAGLLCERRSAPMATYLFRHALIRDAAYESLLRRTRQQIMR